LQPGDLSHDDIRRLILTGQEVLFVKVGGSHGYGVVTVEDGKLTFQAAVGDTN